MFLKLIKYYDESTAVIFFLWCIEILFKHFKVNFQRSLQMILLFYYSTILQCFESEESMVKNYTYYW